MVRTTARRRSARSTSWSTMPASSTSRRSRNSRSRNGTRSSPSICRPRSTPSAPRVPGMKARKWGRIINTASAHSLVASPFKVAYVVRQARPRRPHQDGRARGRDLRHHRQRISPGYVWTPLVEKQIPDTMKARGMTEEQVKRDVLLAAQPTKEFVTVDEVAALARLSLLRCGAVDHRRQLFDRRRLDGGIASAQALRREPRMPVKKIIKAVLPGRRRPCAGRPDHQARQSRACRAAARMAPSPGACSIIS